MSENGHGAQVVKVREDHTYELDERELESVLLQDGIKDLPVVVVSVAGTFRRGKSFLLNFFLRYLTAPQSARDDGSWLGEDSEPLVGFSWRSGSKRNTTGILLWSEPVVTALPSGDKVAVLLMDTQGTFDSESTVRDCSTIFALSTLLSSVQIYNLTTNIHEDDLQHLQLFTEYGRMLRHEEGSKAFQTLEFLVRDWSFPDDYAFGATGGELFLREKLKVTPKMAQEMKDLRIHITSCFEKVSCFLMPHPGLKVLRKTFNGELSEIDPEFKEQLKNLVASIFSPEKLLPKQMHGELVRARELCTYFKTYMPLFNSDEIASPTTIYEATVRAGMLTAQDAAREEYSRGMRAECGPEQPSVPAALLKRLHDKYFAAATDSFTRKSKMGSPEVAKTYLDDLIEELKKELPAYLNSNLAKTQEAINRAEEAYEKVISDVSKGKLLCVHPADLTKLHQEAYDAAVKIFDASRRQVPGVEDKERLDFLKTYDRRLTLLQLDNEQNNNTNVMQISMQYFESMQSACNVEPPLSESGLQSAHDAALRDALRVFDAKRNRPNQYSEDVFKYNLTQAITKTFVYLKALNKSLNKVAIEKAIRVYNQYMWGAWDAGKVCLHPLDLEAEHLTGRCRALQALHPATSCARGVRHDDADEGTLLDVIDQRYQELKSTNDSANKSAMQQAFNKYCAVMDQWYRPKLSWLIIVPILEAATQKSEHHAQAKEQAINLFYSKRRPSKQGSDLYYKDLLTMMKKAYDVYQTNFQNIVSKITEIATMVLGSAVGF